jgi:hypothetical protein
MFTAHSGIAPAESLREIGCPLQSMSKQSRLACGGAGEQESAKSNGREKKHRYLQLVEAKACGPRHKPKLRLPTLFGARSRLAYIGQVPDVRGSARELASPGGCDGKKSFSVYEALHMLCAPNVLHWDEYLYLSRPAQQRL